MCGSKKCPTNGRGCVFSLVQLAGSLAQCADRQTYIYINIAKFISIAARSLVLLPLLFTN